MTSLKISKCGKCNFWDKRACIGGKGNPSSRIMLIAESPGKLEVNDDLGIFEPLVGESGAITNYAFRKAGMWEDSSDRYKHMYFTNAVKCYPKGEIKIQNSNACKKHLEREIKLCRPKFVILFGSHALRSFSGDTKASVEKERGFWKWSEKYKCWYMSTIHPAVLMRDCGTTSSFFTDVKRFVTGIKEGVKEQKLGKSYTVLDSFSKAKAVLNMLKKKKRVAWDLETSSLKFWETTTKVTGNEEDVLGFSFCWGPGRAAYIPMHTGNPDGTLKSLFTKDQLTVLYKKLKIILENPKIKKDGQNTKFDINWAEAKGIIVKGTDWDTMQFHHLIDENTPSNLTYLTTYYDLNFPYYEGTIKPYIKKRKGDDSYIWIPTKILGTYACADVDAVWKVRLKQLRVMSPRQKTLYYEYSVPISKFARAMEYKGVLIDVSRIKEMEEKYDVQIFGKEEELRKLVKNDKFNLNSPPQMINMLFGSKDSGGFGCEIHHRTKTGKPSTDKDAVENIRRKYGKNKRLMKVLNLIGEIRRMKKMKSTYLTGFRKIVDKNNRVHTSYLTTGTVTGRLASAGPNLQNIPRDPLFRSLFIAGLNRWFIAADYKQVEYRLMAWFAMEMKLLKKFEDPDFDIHTENSAVARQKKYEDVTKEERSYDKAVTFGINYGRSIWSIAEEYERDYNDVQDFVDTYFRENPRIARFRSNQPKLARKNGYLETPTGRRRHFTAYEWIYSPEMKKVIARRERIGETNYMLTGIIGNMERQAFNFPIQSFASDCLSKATDRIRKRLKKEDIDAFLILTVHDMIGIESSDKDLELVKKILDEEMSFSLSKKSLKTGKKFKMDFLVDYDIEHHWAQ